MSAWTLKDCRAREAKYRATLAKIPGAFVPQADEDRAQLLALVNELLDRVSESCHVPEGEMACTDTCPGCEAEELMEA